MAGRAGGTFLGKIAVVVLAALIVGVVLYIAGLASRRGELPRPPIGQGPLATGLKMQYDWPARTVGGEDFDLASTKGKVVFLNIWATWCPPCVAEMPAIQRLYDKVKGDGIAFVVIAQDSPKAVREFVEERGLTMPVYTTTGPIPPSLVPESIPTTYIVAQDGEVIFKHVGAAGWDDDAVAEFLRRLTAR